MQEGISLMTVCPPAFGIYIYIGNKSGSYSMVLFLYSKGVKPVMRRKNRQRKLSEEISR